MSVFLFVVLALGATARLTRLITTDHITGRLRALALHQRAGGPDGSLSYFLTCPWCVSFWVALAVIATGWWPACHGNETWWWFPAAALTASYATGFLASHED